MIFIPGDIPKLPNFIGSVAQSDDSDGYAALVTVELQARAIGPTATEALERACGMIARQLNDVANREPRVHTTGEAGLAA